MKSASLLDIAAVVAALTVLAIAFVLVPDPLWTTVTIVTAIGFAVSVGFVFYVPSIFRQKRQGTDAQQMAAIGPFAVSSMLLLLAMGAGFVMALLGYQKLGLAMLIFGIGAFLVTGLLLNAALKVVGDVSNKWSQPSHHVNWQGKVAILASQATHKESLAGLNSLSEKLRYLASDVSGGSPQDSGIEQILSAMSAQLQSNSAVDLTVRVGEINSLLTQRDVYLRTARSKA
jgi:hypothetical protein